MKRNKAILLIFGVTLLLSLWPVARGASSLAQVEFTPGTGPTFPVFPEDPATPGNEGSVTGSLAIVSISDFDFDALEIKTTPQRLSTVTAMPNIQVVDLRGTEVGWKVQASVSRFSSDGTNQTLPGARLIFVKGRPNSVSVSPAPTQNEGVVLPTDGTFNRILFAENGAGNGLWVMRWYADGDVEKYVQLDIPAGTATVGTHTATVEWVLEDTP